MEYLEFILAIIGAISASWFVIKLIIAIFASSEEWQSNIEIKSEDYNKAIDYNDEYLYSDDRIYPEVFLDSSANPDYLTVTYFIPNDKSVFNVRIKEVDEDSIPKGKEKYKTIKKYKKITPENPLCVIVERGEVIAKYIVEWKTQYGAKATYHLYGNMRDSRYNQIGISYHYSLWAKIRRLLDI